MASSFSSTEILVAAKIQHYGIKSQRPCNFVETYDLHINDSAYVPAFWTPQVSDDGSSYYIAEVKMRNGATRACGMFTTLYEAAYVAHDAAFHAQADADNDVGYGKED
jgi:hypothetical protein